MKEKMRYRWKNRNIQIGVAFAFLSISLGGYSCQDASSSDISYLQDIQPILATKCYACHGPDEAKREAGLRLDRRESFFEKLESGKPAVSSMRWSDSELIKRIQSTDPEYQMPPPEFSKPLEVEEIQLLQQWVEDGVAWENHWSLEPIKKQTPPKIKNQAWAQNPIDYFISAAHEAQGLAHAPEADKQTLIRRLTYDLHGLPPTPEELDAFLKDDADDAYVDLVDRLLASPRYGERWARHWLDVVHYGETHGYDKDKRRPNAWPYRDYVIDALNRDIPYGRFIEDQIAGDIMYPDAPQSTTALGFLAAGPWDFVGHAELRENTKDKRIVRNLDRDDMVTNAISSFTSLTVQCARCHDHKFDPIRQKDYYALQAVFAGIDRADRPFDENPPLHQRRIHLKKEKKKIVQQLGGFEEQLDSTERDEMSKLLKEKEKLARKIQQLKRPASSTFGYHSKIEQQAAHTKWVQVDFGESQKIEKIILVPAYPSEGLVMPGYGFPLRFKLELSNTPNFNSATSVVDFSQADHHERTDAPYVLEVDGISARYIRITAYKLWKGRGNEHFFALGELQALSNGKNVARNKRVKASDQVVDKRWAPRFLSDGFSSRSLLSGEDLPERSLNEVQKAEAELAILNTKENELRRAVLNEEEQKQLDRIRAFMIAIEDSLASLPTPSYVYAAATDYNGIYQFQPIDSIRPIFLLNRGDTEQPGEEVLPGTVKIFDELTDQFELPAGHPEGDRRVALAKWMTDEKNAFTWRSIVNRVWQYHFGRGIVASPNDFGKMGTPPTHPELLDYLAAGFLENGQSLKWLHRLIVNSATYKQQSSHHEKNFQLDSENRYLWKANRRQLEAEAVRDGVLATSGKLDLTMGGPGFDAFRYEDDHSPRYLYKDYDASDPSSFRRSIYRFIVRSVPDPFMSTLDCADPSQSVPVRNETITALQALSALNNPFMVRQADFFAERLKREKQDLEAQITRAFELAIQRPPKREEQVAMKKYANEHGLSAACRLIYAMNEFLYID